MLNNLRISEDCEVCELKDTTWYAPKGNTENPRILFIADSPRSNNLQEDNFFFGLSDKIFKALCHKFEFNFQEDCFTYVSQCSSQNKAPTTTVMNLCGKTMEDRIKSLNPQLIVLFGANVAKFFFSNFTRLTAVRGEIFSLYDTYPCLVTFDPNILMIEDSYGFIKPITMDLKKAYNFVHDIIEEEELPKETKVITITQANYKDVFDVLNAYDYLAYDWETTGLNPRVNEGFCLGLCGEQGVAYIVPQRYLRNESILEELKRLFNRKDIQFIAYNAVFDASFNTVYGIEPRIDHDPMLMHYLLDERKQRRSLENLSVDYCNAPRYESQMLAEYDTDKTKFLTEIPEHIIHKYCGMDADYTFRLFKCFWRELHEPGTNERLLHFYKTMFIPAANMIREIQHYGLHVDKDRLESMIAQYEQEVEYDLVCIKELAGDPEFNPDSPKQVSKKVWDDYSMQQPDIFGRKDRSVDKATREALLKQYPNDAFVSALMDYKSNSVTLTRYLKPLQTYLEPDGRVRTSWHLDRTETGRLSTSNPPLHQIPRESEIRTLLCAPEGYTLIQADYAQVEMRMAAQLADDLDFAEIFNSGVDFHRKMAAEAYKITPEEVTPEQRQAAKGVSFGLLYLMGVKKLADFTGLPEKEAYKFVAEYKKLMPGVMQWIEDTKKAIEKTQEVWSLFGRVRRFPLILVTNKNLIFRQGVNMPIQSSASDLTLWSALMIHKYLKEHSMDARIILSVHDSIVVECAEGIANEVAQIVYDTMTTPPFDAIVPFDTEIKIGPLWGKGTLWEGDTA